MWSASPMSRVAAVKTPTLVGLGLKDLRVPPSQGTSWYHMLRKHGICREAVLREYPSDGHSLNSVAAEADFAISMLLFFSRHRDTK